MRKNKNKRGKTSNGTTTTKVTATGADVTQDIASGDTVGEAIDSLHSAVAATVSEPVERTCLLDVLHRGKLVAHKNFDGALPASIPVVLTPAQKETVMVVALVDSVAPDPLKPFALKDYDPSSMMLGVYLFDKNTYDDVGEALTVEPDRLFCGGWNPSLEDLLLEGWYVPSTCYSAAPLSMDVDSSTTEGDGYVRNPDESTDETESLVPSDDTVGD